jgi:hypothetical protein
VSRYPAVDHIVYSGFRDVTAEAVEVLAIVTKAEEARWVSARPAAI